MKINEVIRKYRKEKHMTQEEMANRLGVTAPAVNKWESGASSPDIALLAPIARLLDISLDELLSFKEELSDVEVSNVIKEIDEMFDKETIEVVFHQITDIIREYPNADTLILSLAAMLDARCLIQDNDGSKEYGEWIRKSYENLLSSKDEATRLRAADCLFGFFLRHEQYGNAEECLKFFSIQNPERKRKLATIYCETGRYNEAYKALEETLFSEYQIMSAAMHEIYMVAMKTEDYKKAGMIIEKESDLSELFEMGEYHRISGKLDFFVAMEDAEQVLDIMDLLLSHTDSLTDFAKSGLYEHMTFKETDSKFVEKISCNLFEQFCEDVSYKFVRESRRWNAFKEKWKSKIKQNGKA